MSAAGFTPIQLYRTTTASAVPSAGNLADGELAINLTDEALYFKNASGVVTLLADSSGALGSVTSVNASGGTTGLTFSGGPITSSGTLTLGGTLAVANGGTGVTLSTGTGRVVLNDSPVFVTPSLGAASATSITTQLGSVGAPSFSFTSDTNTGMWSPSSDAIAFSTAGSERVRVDSSGNVGIGTTSPGNRLDVNGTIWARASTAAIGMDVIGRSADNAGQVRFLNNAASTTLGTLASFGNDLALLNNTASFSLLFGTNSIERMRIDSSGNVGIGTSSPGSRLTVSGTGFQGGSAEFISTNSGNSIAVQGVNGAGINDSAFILFKDGTTSRDAFIGLTGDAAGAGAMRFATGGNTERMRIDSSGNVGIGTSSPNAKLHVEGGSVRTSVSYIVSGAGELKQSLATGGIALNSTGVNGIAFETGGTPAERMRISNAGNVGIGTSAPATLLDVSQSANAAVIGRVNNANAGASADARLLVSNGTTQSGMIMRGTGHASANHLVLFQNSTTAPMTFFTNGSERMRIDSSGNLLVGTSSTFDNVSFLIAQFQGGLATRISTDALTSQVSFFNTNGRVGFIGTEGTTTSYNTSSDARLKHEIVDAPDAADLIDAIKVRSFKWNADNSEQRYGMVAQELLEVAPEAVSAPGNPDEMMGVDYSKLVPILVKEIQSLRARVAQLEGN